MKENFVKDALYYVHKQSGSSDEKARGVIIGLVSGLMAHGKTFEECMSIIKRYMEHHPEKEQFRPMVEMLPECWIKPYQDVK